MIPIRPAEFIAHLVPAVAFISWLFYEVAKKWMKRRRDARNRREYLSTRINPKQR
jgi:hypothetical protein